MRNMNSCMKSMNSGRLQSETVWCILAVTYALRHSLDRTEHSWRQRKAAREGAMNDAAGRGRSADVGLHCRLDIRSLQSVRFRCDRRAGPECLALPCPPREDAMRGPRGAADLSGGSAHPRSDIWSLQSVHFRFDRTGGGPECLFSNSRTRTTPQGTLTCDTQI